VEVAGKPSETQSFAGDQDDSDEGEGGGDNEKEPSELCHDGGMSEPSGPQRAASAG
jgi:hypothetical protein